MKTNILRFVWLGILTCCKLDNVMLSFNLFIVKRGGSRGNLAFIVR